MGKARRRAHLAVRGAAVARLDRNDPAACRGLLNNHTILQYFRRADPQYLTSIAESFPDLNSAAVYLGDKKNQQGLGVLAELRLMIESSFIGVFGEAGDFSMRDFVRQKGGRTLFVEYDVAIGDTLGPLYSLLLDYALKEAMSRATRKKADGSTEKGNVYVIIDEFRLLPNMQHIVDAVNFGRSMGLKIIIGLPCCNVNW